MKRPILCVILFLSVMLGSHSTVAQTPLNGGFPCPASVTSITGGTPTAEEITPELTALARNLENSPVRIFYYVHFNIRYDHYFGAKKGALLTLLEGSGNDFDQCALLVALLRAAAQNLGTPGIYTVKYQFGPMSIPFGGPDTTNPDTTLQPNIRHWLGLKLPLNGNHHDCKALLDTLNWIRGYPNFVRPLREDRYVLYEYTGPNTYDLQNFIFQRVWVKLTYAGPNGATYCLDPSFKVALYQPGIDLSAAMGLNVASLVTAVRASGSQGTPVVHVEERWCKNLNWDNLSAHLTTYSANLLTDLQTPSHRNFSFEQVVGGYKLPDYTEPNTLPGLPFLVKQGPFQAWATMEFVNGTWVGVNYVQENIPTLEWDHIPVEYMSKLRLQLDAIDTTLSFPALKGRKLTLTFYDESRPLLSLDDVGFSNPSPASSGAASMTTTILHPLGNWNYQNSALELNAGRSTFTDGGRQYVRSVTGGYVIFYSFGDPKELYRRRQEKLDSLIRAGYANASLPVVTESLNLIGLAYLQQYYLVNKLICERMDVLPGFTHTVGRACQETGFYLDFHLPHEAPLWTAGSPGSYAFGAGPTADKMYIFSFFGSGLEHGVIEQQQDNPALSSTKSLFLANRDNQKIMLGSVDNGPTINSLLNSEGIRPLSYAERMAIYLSIYDPPAANNFRTLLLPSGKSIVGERQGIGWFSFYNNGNGLFWIEMPINGGYNGGYAGFSGIVNGFFQNQFSFSYAPTRFDFTPPSLRSLFGADPVSLQDGSFHLDTEDLSAGQKPPRGFAFSRHYSSNRRHNNDSYMAHGWTHNFMMRAAERSDAAAGLGRNTAREAAPMIVATHVARAVFSSTTSIPEQVLRWAMTALIAEWGVDQLKKNAVSITLGKQTLQFIKQADGSYSAPAGVTHTLTKPVNDGYILQERHGNTFRFDKDSGRIATITDPYGKSMLFSYAPTDAQRLASIVDAWGGPDGTLTFTYDNATPPRLQSVSTGAGGSARSVSFSYDTTYSSQSDLVSVTDPEGKVQRYEYDGEHKILKTKDATVPNPRVIVENTYDADGKVTQQFSEGIPANVSSFFVAGRVTVEKDPLGSRKIYYYDEKTRPYALVDQNGKVARSFHDGEDHVVAQMSPKGELSYFVYDGRNNLLESHDESNEIEYREYDSLDRLVATTDKNGFQTTYSYHSTLPYRVQSVTSPFGVGQSVTEQFSYYPIAGQASDGSLQGITDASGNTTSLEYNARGRLNKVTPPAVAGQPSGVVTSVYLDTGDMDTQTDAKGQVTRYTYNKRRQMLKREMLLASGNIVWEAIYDNNGNVWKQIDPRLNTTEYTYTADARLVETKLPIANELPVGESLPSIPVSQNIYEARNLLWKGKNPLNHETQWGYDVLGRPNAITDPLGRVATADFDENGRHKWSKSSLTAQEQKTQYAYNDRGELTAQTDPLGFAIAYGYDPNGNRVTVTDRNQGSYEAAYFNDNRLKATKLPSGKETLYTYNNRGLVQTVVEPSGQATTFNTYDQRGRLTVKTDSVGTSTYTYDANNNLVVHAEGTTTVTRGYDALDQLISYTFADTANSSRNYSVAYKYDANGNLEELTYPGGKKVTYQYNNHNLLWKVTDWLSRQTVYKYDLAGRLRIITRPNGTSRFIDYNTAGEVVLVYEISASLVPLCYWKYGYDTGGRRDFEFAGPVPPTFTEPNHTFTHDIDNKVATVKLGAGAPVSPTYDLDGNMLTGPSTTSVSGGTYAYNARNQLVSFTAAGQTTSYAYDSEGNRIFVQVGSQTTRYAVSPAGGLSEVLVRTKHDATRTLYVYGLGLLYEDDDAGNMTTYHFDSRGSTVALTGSSGAVVYRTQYSPYGTRIPHVGTTDTPFLFNGEDGVMSDANGLYYMRSRYYNPYIRRFINPDPSGLSGGLNLYAFADGNPVSRIDPLGLASVSERVAARTSGWLDGTALGEWGKGFNKGIDRWASGVDPNTYASHGSASYQDGMRSGYGFVPNMVEIATFAAATAPILAGSTRSAASVGFRSSHAGKKGDPFVARYGDGTLVRASERPPYVSGPDPLVQGSPHTGLRWDANRRLYGAKEFGNGGIHPTRDISFTQPTFPNGTPRPGHLPPPTQHPRVPNPSGGSPIHGPEQPLQFP